MKYSLTKKVRGRVARAASSLADLRPDCENDAEVACLMQCIAAMRDAGDRIDAIMLTLAPGRPQATQEREQIRAPGPIEKPDYSPGSGVTRAKDRRERIVGDARNYVPDDDDDGLAPINPHAGPAEQIEEYLQGRRGGIYECEAAKEFVRLDTNEWRGMDDVERVAAIKARGDELRRSEDDGEAASPAAAPAVPDDGMF